MICKVNPIKIYMSMILLLLFWGSPPVAAEEPPDAASEVTDYLPQDSNAGAVYFQIVDLPEELQNRSFLAWASLGPADASQSEVILSGLNDFSAPIELPPGTYYCAAAMQYDPAGDYPVVERSGQSVVTVTAGETTLLTYQIGAGFYQSITGQERFSKTLQVEQAPTGYDTTRSAQIGAYLTAPEGFDQRVTVYLGNLYTGKTYPLEIYAANLLAAISSNATAGKYQYLGAAVAGDEKERYTISTSDSPLTTEQGATFHLTITDTLHPNRTLTTPSREGMTPEAAASPSDLPKATAGVEITSPPPQARVQHKTAGPFFWVVELAILGIICAGIFFYIKQKWK